MSTRGSATFAIKSWDEKPYAEFEGGRKLTRASVVYTYSGDIEGEGSVEYLMVYGPHGAGTYVGMERVVGKVAGRSGSFVSQHTGTFEPKGVSDTWFISPESGTGELEGLSGGGDAAISGHGPYSIAFDYDQR